MISKENFVKYMKFIEAKQLQENKLADILEEMSPTFRCDALVYADYEENFLELLREVMQDKTDLIGYKMYEFDQFDEEEKAKQLLETPEVESWETVYDFLTSKEG